MLLVVNIIGCIVISYIIWQYIYKNKNREYTMKLECPYCNYATGSRLEFSRVGAYYCENCKKIIIDVK